VTLAGALPDTHATHDSLRRPFPRPAQPHHDRCRAIPLAGIVVDNAIVLDDFIQQLRARSLEKTRALATATRSLLSARASRPPTRCALNLPPISAQESRRLDHDDPSVRIQSWQRHLNH
jgi:hypothetical protein